MGTMERRVFLKYMVSGAALAAQMSALSLARSDQSLKKEEPNLIEFARRLRIFVYEGDPFWGNASKLAEVMHECNANAIRYTGGIRHGLTCYPSKYFPPHPQLGNRDLLGEMVQACQKYKFYIFPHIQFLYAFRPEAACLHSDWAAMNADGTPIKVSFGAGSGPTDGMAICYNNPDVVEAYSLACQEIVQHYPVAGIYFDIAWRGNCFCQYCKKQFVQQFGYELPDSPFADKKHKHDYIHGIRIQGIRQALQAVTAAIKSVRDLPIIFNMVEANKRYSRHCLMEFAAGALVAEINNCDYLDIMMRVKAGAAFHRAIWCYCPVSGRDQLVTQDDIDTKISALVEIAHGGTPIVETIRAYLHDDSGIPQLNQVFSFMQKNENLFYDFTPVRWLALHCSTQTALEYGIYDSRSNDTERGNWDNTYFSGAFSALTYAHHPFNVILDQDIQSGELEKYQVIFLPNVACLSKNQIDAIKKFVWSGGGLIATYETSLFDEKGRRRDNFGLADIFQVSYLGSDNDAFHSSSYMEGPYLRVCNEHPVAAEIRIGKKIAYAKANHPFVRVSEPAKSSLVADIYYADQGEFGKPLSFPGGNPPAVIAGNYGKGRFVYMPAALDYAYAKIGFQLIRQLMDNSVRFLVQNRLLIKTDAPSSVALNLTEFKDRKLLHLLNFSGSTLNKDKARLESIVPIYNIHFSIAETAGKKLKKVSRLIGATDLDFTSGQGYCHFTLSELAEYECLIFKLQD
jgi:hypothetical protein